MDFRYKKTRSVSDWPQAMQFSQSEQIKHRLNPVMFLLKGTRQCLKNFNIFVLLFETDKCDVTEITRPKVKKSIMLNCQLGKLLIDSDVLTPPRTPDRTS